MSTYPKKTYRKKNNTNYKAKPKAKPKANNYASKLYANYKKPYKYPGLGRTIGSVAGGALGAPFGMGAVGSAAGGVIGQAGHSIIKTITGHGDYTVQENAMLYNRDAVPQFSSENPRCTVVTHSEFIKDVRGSTAFALDSFNINASNPALFPWLSQVARNYEQIVWQGLVFQFKTTCGTAVSSTNTAMGTVVMATQYNSLAESFINKQQMENYEFSQSSVPSASLMHPIECDPSLTAGNGLFYVDNPTDSDNNADPRLYNLGKFNIATVGMQAAATIGELWCTYKVCLMKPRQVGNNNQSDQWILDYATLTELVPFGIYPVLTSSSTSALYNIPRQYNALVSDQSFTALGQSPWEATAGNGMLFINPAFTGQIVVVFQVDTPGVLAVNEPIVAVTGNITKISDPSLAIGFADYSLNGCLGGLHCVYAFQVQGGYNSTGNGPRITFSGGSYPALNLTVSQAALAIYAVANNLRNPNNP